MPRVTQAHLAARRREILEAAYRCFSRSGFHDVRMQEVADEAGLSVGALYRYFAGKDALITALAARGREQKRGAMAVLETGAGASGLARLAAELVGVLRSSADARAAARLDVRLWGEALGQAALRDVVERELEGFRAPIASYVRRERKAGRIRADADPEMVARLVLSLVAGLELQMAFEPDLKPERYVTAAGLLLECLGA